MRGKTWEKTVEDTSLTVKQALSPARVLYGRGFARL